MQPGEPPIPLGKVVLNLSDKRILTLSQTISVSGIRYADENEFFIFWSKGDTAFVIENNTEIYSDCITSGN